MTVLEEQVRNNSAALYRTPEELGIVAQPIESNVVLPSFEFEKASTQAELKFVETRTSSISSAQVANANLASMQAASGSVTDVSHKGMDEAAIRAQGSSKTEVINGTFAVKEGLDPDANPENELGQDQNAVTLSTEQQQEQEVEQVRDKTEIPLRGEDQRLAPESKINHETAGEQRNEDRIVDRVAQELREFDTNQPEYVFLGEVEDFPFEMHQPRENQEERSVTTANEPTETNNLTDTNNLTESNEPTETLGSHQEPLETEIQFTNLGEETEGPQIQYVANEIEANPVEYVEPQKTNSENEIPSSFTPNFDELDLSPNQQQFS